jgi:hypothetical protein
MDVFQLPCRLCRDGQHDQCRGGLCGCIADHPDDTAAMRGFKRIKRALHPERETQVKDGWS